MIHSEMSWRTQEKKVELYAQAWEPDAPVKAAVCLVHGLGDHSGRYAYVAQFLTQGGYSVLAVDLHGHGKATGQRGHVPSSQAFLEDIDRLLQEAERRHPGKPRFLYGHSLGGLLVLFYALRRKPQLAGVISSSPGLRSPVLEQKAKIAFAKIMGSLLPSLSIPVGLDAATISRDPEVVQAYQKDPLVHDVVTLATTKYSIQIVPWTWEHAAEFSLPLLLMHGTGDRLTYHAGSQEFSRLIPGDCTLKLWDGLYHELHNEPEKDQVLNCLVAWMDDRLDDVD
jgi:alpha-beta hydrolase superfamily lysophospholipase